MENDNILFAIKEVAKELGVNTATIRNWEKAKLFVAKRNSNNYRVYSFDDIEILKKIKQYSIDEHLNFSSIKNILHTTQQEIAPGHLDNTIVNETKYSKKLLGNKWKQYRDKKNLTLEELSLNTGISTSYLSKIERCEANVSLDILNKIAAFYEESLIFFYENDKVETNSVKKDEREPIDVGLSGVYIESLMNRKNALLNIAMFTVLPGCGSFEYRNHQGEEFVYVIDGELIITLNNYEYDLKTGDSMFMKSKETHIWHNPGKKVTTAMWVHIPVGG